MPNNRPAHPAGAVSLAQKAAGRRGVPAHPVPPKKSRGRRIVMGILIAVIALTVAFLAVGAVLVSRWMNTDGKSRSANLAVYQGTPEAERDKVAYYVFGLLGKDQSSPLETLSLVCWDKEAGTFSLLDIPQDTYLGDSGDWAAARAADVWANPRPLNWCTSCREEVPDDEIKDGKHTVCQTAITKMPGSSSGDLCSVFNKLFGLPVDGYVLFQQESLVKLVNLLGGVDVNLAEPLKVGEMEYPAGVQTLAGDAALYYAVSRKDGIAGDIGRLPHARQVFVAVFQRLSRMKEERLSADYIGPLMNGSTPLLTNMPRDTVDEKTGVSQLVVAMSGVKPSAMTAYVLPGSSRKSKGTTYYSGSKDAVLALLNQAFRPVGDKLTADNLLLADLGGKADETQVQNIGDIAVEQSGAVTPTSAGS